jgi:hypothetical protein
MGLRWSHVSWFLLVFVTAVVELTIRSGTPGPVTAMAAIALVTSVAALHFEHRRSRQRVAVLAGPDRRPIADQAPTPAGPVVSFPTTPPPPPVTATRVAPPPNPNNPGSSPPLFGDRGSAAHNRPWHLPPRLTQPGISADEATLGHLTVRAASIVGPGHRCEEPALPRQDAYALGRDASGRWLAIAVADGLSSGRRSDLGAQTAAHTAVQLLIDAINQGERVDFPGVFAKVAARLVDDAQHLELPPTELSTVLIAGYIDSQPNAQGAHTAAFAWVGDVCVITPRGGGWETIGGDAKSTKDGLESNVVAASLPSEPHQVKSQSAKLSAGSCIVFATDGVSDVIRMERSASDYFYRRWQRPIPAADFLTDISYEARGHQDDRTAVGVWVETGSGRG